MYEAVHAGNLSTILKMEEGLYFREGNHELRDQCNVGIVELPDSLVLIDYPEQDPDEEILDEAEDLLGKPVHHIIITHPHCDHVTGFKTLRRQDISVIARASCLEEMRREGYPVPTVHMAVTESTELVLGGVTFDLVLPKRTAHSPWDMLVGLPRYGTVFTGDLVARERTMFFHSSDIAGWREAVDALRQRGWKRIARGHGAVAGPDYLDETALYLYLLEQTKIWQAAHHETVTETILAGAMQELSPQLRQMAARLLQYTDAANVSRQINQLMVRTREGY